MGKRNSAAALLNPEEIEEQIALYEWAEYQIGRYPALKWMYHIPNEGKRSPITGARLKLAGLKPGVLDNCLPVPRGIYAGLYFEMKRRKGGKVSEDQREWLEGLQAQGYKTAVCRGWEEAAELILDYLKMEV